MRLSSRSYPHPVLGNADDVPEAAFQATCEVVSDKQFFFITVTVACSSTTLNKLVQKGSASFVLHVECGNTLYRHAFDFFEQTKRFEIRADLLNGQVEVNCFVRATRELTKYSISGAHEDYGNAVFDLRSGDILAVGESYTFEAESQDTLRRIGSIMVVEQSNKDGDHPMEVKLNDDKIRIRLCKDDFEKYKKLKAIPSLASHLTTTIVLPVLIEALHVIKSDEAQFEGLKWCRNLTGRLDELKLNDEEDTLKKAQMLLDMPLRRAFASAAEYATENS
jgi:hypothetical protein